MKPLSVLPAALLLTTALALPASAAPDLVILVRHAERGSEPAGDPALTPAGEQRAQALAQALAGAQVSAILTTQFRRTRDTAAPLARTLGLQPQVVDAKAGHVQAVADAVLAQTALSSSLVTATRCRPSSRRWAGRRCRSCARRAFTTCSCCGRALGRCSSATARQMRPQDQTACSADVRLASPTQPATNR